jgi:translation initiation factor 1
MSAGKPFHNPFEAALGPLRDAMPPVADTAPTPGAVDTGGVSPDAVVARVRGPARAVVRLERSGRGGKEVTVVEQLGLSQSEQAAWLKALKAALGCGGVAEGDNLVLQGDQRKRLPALLTARGVRRVTVS